MGGSETAGVCLDPEGCAPCGTAGGAMGGWPWRGLSWDCYDSHDTQTLFFSFTHLLHSDSYLSHL